MTNKKSQVPRLTPDPDKIAKLYGIDQIRAKAIYEMLKAVEDATRELILVQTKIVKEQAEFIEKQEDTARTIERELGRERDAKRIIQYIETSLTGQPASSQSILAAVFTPPVATELGKLGEQELINLFAVIKEALANVRD